MIHVEKTLERYKYKGEKSGWTFVKISADEAHSLKPNNKKSFRIKGSIDKLVIKQLALIPIGEGQFILPVNGSHRKVLKKEAGDNVLIAIEEDNSELENSADLLACLEDEPRAEAFFNTLSKSHQRYFSTWIEGAKTIETKTKRLSQSLSGLSNEMDYGQMVRFFKKKKDENGF